MGWDGMGWDGKGCDERTCSEGAWKDERKEEVCRGRGMLALLLIYVVYFTLL